jgi:hypothetical protein
MRRKREHNPSYRPPLQTFVRVLLLLSLSGSVTVRCKDDANEVLRTGTLDCNGTEPCVSEASRRKMIISPDGMFRDTENTPLTTESAVGFDPKEPCPSTNIKYSDDDLHSIENQVSPHISYIWGPRLTQGLVTRVQSRAETQPFLVLGKQRSIFILQYRRGDILNHHALCMWADFSHALFLPCLLAKHVVE